MMNLKIERDARRLGPQYKIVFDYNNQHEKKLHSLMLGVEAMLNYISSGPTTKVEVRTYNAHIPEFIPGCFCQYVQFEKIWTTYNGVHIRISIRDPETLYPITGILSPIDYIEKCKNNALKRLIFNDSDCIEIPYKNYRQVFNQCRNWIYTHFGYNARNNVWRHFEQQVSQEIRRKFPYRQDFLSYSKESAISCLKDEKINPGSKYYNDRLQFWVDFYTRDINKYYKGE